jgi:hypothetical protein
VKEFFGSSYTLTLQKPSKMRIVKREEEGEGARKGKGCRGSAKRKGKKGVDSRGDYRYIGKCALKRQRPRPRPNLEKPIV